jgi:steroid delta-isomerase-like uncharacterized protein
MTTTEGQATTALDEFCARYLDAWNSRDETRMAPLVTDDVVWYDPALPAPARGTAEVQQFMRDAWRAFPDLRFEEPEPHAHRTAEGGHVAWAWRMLGTWTGPLDPPGFAPTGRAFQIDGVDLWELRDGRIAHYRAFYDMNGLAQQLGIAPPPGSRGERAMVRLQRLQARMMRRRG